MQMYWAEVIDGIDLLEVLAIFVFVFIHVAMTLNVVYILLTGTFYMNYMNVAF